MVREIEFRGKSNNKWIYSKGYKQSKETIALFNDDWEWRAIEPNTLGQYTGLKDKNGTKIFEGDVLIGDIPELIESQNLIGVVEYEESAFIVKFPNRKSWQIQKVGFCSFINYRVIGNLYDNSELIKE